MTDHTQPPPNNAWRSAHKPDPAHDLPPLAPAFLGRNELKLNGATMNRAVQEFFDRHAPALGVEVDHVRGNTPDGTFIIETREVGTKP